MMGHRPVLVLSELGRSQGRGPLFAPSLRTWPCCRSAASSWWATEPSGPRPFRKPLLPLSCVRLSLSLVPAEPLVCGDSAPPRPLLAWLQGAEELLFPFGPRRSGVAPAGGMDRGASVLSIGVDSAPRGIERVRWHKRVNC